MSATPLSQISDLRLQALDELEKCSETRDFKEYRTRWFGAKRGIIKELLRSLGQVPAAERRELGAAYNSLSAEINAALKDREQVVAETADSVTPQAKNTTKRAEKSAAKPQNLDASSDDLTRPHGFSQAGSLHPITQTIDEICEWFEMKGYRVAEGPEIEDDEHNFTRLNIPSNHPARSMHDTFFVNGDVDGDANDSKDDSDPSNWLLRTHTSPMQVRLLDEAVANDALPLAVICPGRVYRRDLDNTHTPMFHQIEGLVVGKYPPQGDDDAAVVVSPHSFVALAKTLQELCQHLFKTNSEVRFRPSYFPFTEPSAEMDISCVSCTGVGCNVCSNSGWLEILGCGLVHPKVLEMAGLDSSEYGGFAFGLGIERIAMLRSGVQDMRLNYENDLRYLRQFERKPGESDELMAIRLLRAFREDNRED